MGGRLGGREGGKGRVLGTGKGGGEEGGKGERENYSNKPKIIFLIHTFKVLSIVPGTW